ncbi:META and DUF4377 domain-containing protein [Luteimonas sp. FCS-9]|uniref:META and DUF4377 domain-containing protein n=1 Tax=Luteimonas sp. FCS-9 TaxID=1547516 RepID=UPI00063E9E08|nr:META and DUF4377 domain-containing protein [Luteimonas sp. FCS-9]KLJ00780.1 hypothetical protein WQ56_08335 [Luteimonas sp. FCS-9]
MRRALPLLLPFALIACSPTTTPPDGASTPDAQSAAAALPDAAPADHTATLGAYHWRLVDARSGTGAAIDGLLAEGGEPLQLDFRDGGVQVRNACNRMSANVALDDDRMTVDQVISTLMACPDERLATLEREIGQRLPGTHRLAIAAGEPPRLTLQLDDGDVLTFDGAPTPATRYGSEGEQVFLEIAPERVACSHPLIPDQRCLQTREVRYDADGVRVPDDDAPWTPLYQEIEGFTHEDGVRNVARVQRFDLRDPPADAPAQAYVLDMVVESETVAR